VKFELPDCQHHLSAFKTAALLIGTVSLLGGCGIRTLAEATIAQMTIPEPIRVPQGHQAVVDATGRGTLVYECQAIKRSPFQYSWLLQTASLKLEDTRGQPVTYLPGSRARWIHSDGSSVSAREFVEVAANGKNLPMVRATAEMSVGPGILDKVSYIQMIKTSGGMIASPLCTEATLGMRSSAAYEAEFVFWRPSS
jgi:hypothetical protein